MSIVIVVMRQGDEGVQLLQIFTEKDSYSIHQNN